MASPAAAGLDRLLEGMRRPGCYPHPVGSIEILETHISAVVLTGSVAYKLKKPVVLPFLDFGSLAKRAFYCAEELRLNRRTAPRLYLDVVPITGTENAPSIAGGGPVIEHAVKMRQFPQEALFDSLARRGLLQREHARSLGRATAVFHAGCARSDPGRASATAQGVLQSVSQNIDELSALVSQGADSALLVELAAWVHTEHGCLRHAIDGRLHAERVRECHGDLHLGNVALIDEVPTPFDCIEFSDELRWIDVSSEIAFVFMDLMAHGLPGLAWSFCDAYLEWSGDYEAAALLRFFSVHRALVRAKVAGIRASQMPANSAEWRGQRVRLEQHLSLARTLTEPAKRALVIMHGLSGSGKSTLAAALLEELAGLRCRSDVERKRLHGMAPEAHSTDEALVYGRQSTECTYRRLAEIAELSVCAHLPVIVDAAFLKKSERDEFRVLAARLGVPFAIVSCGGAVNALHERLAARAVQGHDPSEAGPEVLDRQLEFAEPLAPEELERTVSVDASLGSVDAVCANVAGRLGKLLGP